MKYYAVKVGRKPGIYNSWEDCQKEVSKFEGATFKSFSSLEDAKNYLEDKEETLNQNIPNIYVDGSFDVRTNRYSFGGVILYQNEIKTFKKTFDSDEFSQFRNVSGEIRGASFVINYSIKNNYKEINLFYDYEGIKKWFTNEWKANTKISMLYQDYASSVRDKIKINFVKIKSHTNNKYNDLADKLAKEALGIN